MITISNPIYLSRNDGYSQGSKLAMKNVKVVLLNEEIFIKTIRLKGKYNLEDVLEENVQSTFSDYDMLIHYEILRIGNNKFLIIYFVNYYNTLKSIVSKCKNIAITPYQLKIGKGKFFRGMSIIISRFRESLYLVIKINGIVVHTKNILQDNIISSIKLSIEAVENNFEVGQLKRKYYKDKDIILDGLEDMFTNPKMVTEEVS